jgi:N-acyl-D-aspartate/D-glutamate deacylase
VAAWALEGGYQQFINRLRDPATRARVVDAIRGGSSVGRFGGPGGILIRGSGKRLDEISREMGVEPAEAVVRLFEQSPRNSPIAIYFSLSEEDMKLALKQPWVSLGSDSGAVVGAMRNRGAHPRAYGTFSRVLGKYVRDEKLMTLEEAIRKMTSLAASRANLRDRGVLKEGMRADVTVFDPVAVRDVSTYEDPHHFSEGVSDVLVNGVAVLRDGKMTGKLPGRMLRDATSGTVVESEAAQGTRK